MILPLNKKDFYLASHFSLLFFSLRAKPFKEEEKEYNGARPQEHASGVK